MRRLRLDPIAIDHIPKARVCVIEDVVFDTLKVSSCLDDQRTFGESATTTGEIGSIRRSDFTSADPTEAKLLDDWDVDLLPHTCSWRRVLTTAKCRFGSRLVSPFLLTLMDEVIDLFIVHIGCDCDCPYDTITSASFEVV